MPPTYDAASVAWGAVGGTSLGWTHTPVGTPSLVLVWMYADAAITNWSGTYGGQTLQGINSVTTSAEMVWFGYLLSPPAGAQSVVLTWTTETRPIGGGQTYTTAFIAPSGFVSGEAVTPTLVGDIVAQCCGNDVDNGHVPGSGQTEVWDIEPGTAGRHGAGYYMAAIDGTTTGAVTGDNVIASVRIMALKGAQEVIWWH